MKSYWTLLIGFVVALIVFSFLWRQGAFLKLSAYFDETKEELRKCTWPTRNELKGSTVVVLVSIALIGVFTVVVDFLIAMIVRRIV